MEPAKGLGWPDQPLAWTPESAGLHHGHAEPEGPELSDGPRAVGSSSPSEVIGLGWPQNSFNNAPPVPVSPAAGAPTPGVSSPVPVSPRISVQPPGVSAPAPVSAPADAQPPGVASLAPVSTPIGAQAPGAARPGQTTRPDEVLADELAQTATQPPLPGQAENTVSGQAPGTAAQAASLRRTGRVNGAADPAHPSPERITRALSAAVSRETAASTANGSHQSGLAGNGVEEAMPGGTTAQNDGNASGIVIPDVPQNPQDTPIARAAEAAVGVRGAGDGHPWPRPGNCRIMTIANQKGGVGKTTTAVNLAASLSQHGSRVLVIDLDPQGNASTALDVDHRVGTPSVYNTLVEDRPLTEVVQPVEGLPGLYCAPATIDLAGAEIELVPLVARESRLSRAVAAYDSSDLDYILIDCPPSLGLLTLNALVAAREVLIPIQCEYYALEGLEQLIRTVDLVKGHLNQDLAVSTILLTMYDGRTRLASQVADDVRSHFGDIVLQSIIPRSVRVSEAPSYGQSVITYDPGSSGSIAYVEAARELSQRHPEMAG
jgi:chromosome partitioning protein